MTKAKATPGRPVSKDTEKLRKRILVLAKKGITNPDLAKKMKLDTMKTQSLCKPLIRGGQLDVEKLGNLNLYTTVNVLD